MTEFGAEIAVDGKRPDWLKDDDKIVVLWRNTAGMWSQPDAWNAAQIDADATMGGEFSWPTISAIKLPADHPYYKATEAGYKYWPGGDKAPDDWDNSTVLLRSGSTCPAFQIDYWKHAGNMLEGGDIIGYKARPMAPAVPPAVPPPPPLHPIAPRWAFELLEKVYAEYRSVEPNPRNIDIMMKNQNGWIHLHAWADYIARTVEAPVDPVVLRAREILMHRVNAGPVYDEIEAGKMDDAPGMLAVIDALREGMTNAS